MNDTQDRHFSNDGIQVNHSIGGDVTGGYMVADPERLRKPMERIETHLLRLCRKDKAKVVNIKVGH